MRQRSYILCFLLILICFANSVPVIAGTPDKNPVFPQTQGKAVLLMDAHSGRVLYEINAHQRLSPASVTKIMTGLLVVEDGELNRLVKVSEKAATTPESAVWLEAGEKLTRAQLLYALMLNSANDASVALAESIAGSEQAFVDLMNQRAQELGMKDTHFCNPHGLEASGHYTSAYDLALLSREAMKYEVFRQVVATKTYHIPWADNDYGRLLINKNRLLWRYDDAIGIKTGYTKQAGNCAVGAAKRGSLTLIAVSMNSPSVYPDLQAMFDYGFSSYSLHTIKEAKQLSVKVPVLNGQEKTVLANPETDIKVAVTPQEVSQLSYTVHIDDVITAPVFEGQAVGVCQVYVEGTEVSRFELLAGSPVAEKPPFLSRLLAVVVRVMQFLFLSLLAVFCLLYLIRIINLKRRNRKRRLYRASR
ncbi:MAG: D-alanyl-D-alanine carboxypeptidase family protein [Bacillota bacterium]